MDPIIVRISENLIARVSGPMKFRLVLQPGMAIFLAIKDGLKDAREGKPAYFWALFTDKSARRAMLEDGWKSVGKVFILAIVLDCIYQVIVLRRIYPGEALLVAMILAIVPYLLVRGPVNRVARSADKSVAVSKKIDG
jgi:hypothetical protein